MMWEAATSTEEDARSRSRVVVDLVSDQGQSKYRVTSDQGTNFYSVQ